MYHNGRLVWYAVCRDNEDTDHGTGSFNRRAAIRLARQYREDGYQDAHIVAVDPADDFCLDIIRDF